MLLCIYCKGNSFELGKGSEEHAILSALGGKKASRNICCEECNNRLGDEVDKGFAEEYAFFSTMLGITTGRKKVAPTHKGAVEHNGIAYDLKPGGEFKLSKATVSLDDLSDGSSEVSIRASSGDQALALMQKVLKRYNQSIDDFDSLEAKSVKSFLPTQHRRLGIGGETQFRAVAKMMLTYFATMVNPERLRGDAFDEVTAFINGGGNAFNGAAAGSRILLPSLVSISEVDHRAIIVASAERKVVVGVLELFGNIQYSVELTSQWDGPDIFKVYTIDPVTSISKETDFTLDVATAFDGYEIFTPDADLSAKQVENVVRIIQQRQTDDQISSITAAAVERHMVRKGDVVTAEMLENFAEEVAVNFTRLMYRVDSDEIIDLKKK